MSARALAFVIPLLLATGGPVLADSSSRSVYDLSLDELLALEVTVASKSTRTTRESPGIVSVITREEIRASGARDLLDLLRRVPGFEFGLDVQGVVGIGTRGFWGHEGKILLLIDGHEMNETLFSGLQFGNHYPVESIERVEVIRGPGSAVYGGYAELGVIKVTTTRGADLRGTRVTADLGRQSNGGLRRSVGLSTGRRSGDLEYAVHGFLGEGTRSDAVYENFWETRYAMKDQAALDPLHLNASLDFGALSARVLYDRYRTTSRDVYGEDFPHPLRTDFSTLSVILGYEHALGDRVTLAPELSWKRQVPWYSADTSEAALDGDYHYTLVARRLAARLVARYETGEAFDLQAGVEVVEDRAGSTADTRSDLAYVFADGGDEAAYRSFAGHAQAALRTGAGDLTLGARLEDHAAFGTSFVPRAAFTRVAGDAHVKLLLSRAYRAPSIMYLDYNGALAPETTTVYELEAGYRLGRDGILTANVFDIAVDDVIVFYYDADTELEGYENFDVVANRGLEVEYRHQAAGGWIGINYAHYVNRVNRIADYAVPGRDGELIGFPRHKANLFGAVDLAEGVGLGATITWYGARRGFAAVDEDDASVVGDFPAEALVSLWLRTEDVPADGLELGLGVRDLLGTNRVFLQPYDGYHAPLPGPTREIHVRVTCRLGG